MKRLTISLSTLFLFVCIFGCTSGVFRRKAVVPKRPPVLSSELFDSKIQSLNDILEKEGLSQKDKEMASKLLEAYKSLKIASSRQFTEPEYDRFIKSMFQTLNLFVENYFAEIHYVAQKRSISLFAKERNKILDAYLSGDSKGVINDCITLKTDFGPDSLTPEIALVFSLSLANQGMLEDAIDIGQGITHALEVSPDLTHLRANIAEWYLKLGQREKAIIEYEKLTDTLDEQKLILRSLSRKIGTTGRVNENLLQRVNQLVQEHKFSQAGDLLALKKDEVTSDRDIKAIDQALRDLELAQEKYLKEKISSIFMREEALKKARELIESEKFEEAISELESLEVKQDNSREVRELKEQAIEGLINRERNRAARIFLAAKNTSDHRKKEEYLKSCYDILNNLLEKYPSSPLREKLKSHIKKVSEELDRLGRD